jgi:hypothetical protein
VTPEVPTRGDPTAEQSNELAQFLEPGESLVWSGKPNPKRVFTRQDRYLLPMSVVLLFLCLPNLSVTTVAPGFVGVLVLFLYLIAILVVLYMVAGRFYYKRVTRECTYYLLTDRRVISVNTLWGVRVRATALTDLALVHISQDARNGTIAFTRSGDLSAWGESTGLPSISILRARSVPAFYDIPDHAAVHQHLLSLRPVPASH